MGTIKFRRTGGGSLRFKRRLNLKWEEPTKFSDFDVTSGPGEVVKAIVFANPRTMGIPELVINDVAFREPVCCDYVVQPQRPNRLVSGNIFRREDPLLSLATWAPAVPPGSRLTLRLGDLEEDAGYEVRIVVPSAETGMTCRFIAHSDTVDIPVAAGDEVRPSVSVAVVRKIGFFPKTNVRILLPGKKLDETEPEVPGQDFDQLAEE